MLYLKEFFKKVDFEKIQQTTKNHEKLPSMQRGTSNQHVLLPSGVQQGRHDQQSYPPRCEREIFLSAKYLLPRVIAKSVCAGNRLCQDVARPEVSAD